MWSAVRDFVAWLVERYDLGDLIPPCWWAHGAFVEELTALMTAWNSAYGQQGAKAGEPIHWHEQFDAARKRLAAWDRMGCAQRGHREPTEAKWGFDAGAFDEFVAMDLRRRSSAGKLAAQQQQRSAAEC